MKLPQNVVVERVRKALRKTQEDVGNIFGISKTAVFYWENGKSRIPPRKFSMFLQIFKVNPEWIETGAGEMFLAPETTQEKKVDVSEPVVIAADPNDDAYKYAKSKGFDDMTAIIFSKYSNFSQEKKKVFENLVAELIGSPDVIGFLVDRFFKIDNLSSKKSESNDKTNITATATTNGGGTINQNINKK